MSKQLIEDKINNIKKVASDIDYLRDEFNGKLFATRDGDVDILSMLEFAMEYDYLLEHIILTAKIIRDTTK